MIAIHEPDHPSHDYLFVMYLRSILRYMQDQKIPVRLIQRLDQAHDETVLADTDFLTRKNIEMLKNRGCKLVGFNMVDSSHISHYCETPEDVDLIFSLTGIQTTNIGTELCIDKEFNVTLEEKQFIPQERWEMFNMMRLTGRLLSLPYVHWEKPPKVEPKPYSERSQKVLIRGGAHFRRVILAFFLMRHELLDCNSGFPMKDYFSTDMNPQFRFCDPCRASHREHKRFLHRSPIERNPQCNSPAVWGGELDLTQTGPWNNRCPESFYWLADKFSERHGPLNPSEVENLLNGEWLDQQAHLDNMARITFSADLKWLHSIYAAQRFWDGAITGCINLLPKRTNDQEYFPNMLDGVHYLTFSEDMKGFTYRGYSIGEAHYEYLAENALSLYREWIEPGEYPLNTKLLAHITERILN